MECGICINAYTNVTKKKIICNFCTFECCQECCKKFILGSINEAHCMSCKKFWSTDFMSCNFPYSFISTEYRTHIENTLFDREKSNLEEVYELTERHCRADELNPAIRESRDKVHNINIKISALYAEVNILNNIKYTEQRVYLELEHKQKNILHTKIQDIKLKFFGNCPKSECKGLITNNWKCGFCSTKVCKTCKEELHDDHVCNQDNIESLELIKRDSKHCPQCNIYIYKIEGCNQMWCTSCNIAFCWRTGEIFKKKANIHNPHYFEWQRNQDGACENASISRFLLSITSIHIDRKIRELCYKLQDIRGRIIPGLTEDNSEEFLEKKMRFVKGDITETVYKAFLHNYTKRRNKQNDKSQIFEMFLNSTESCMGQFLVEYKDNKFKLKHDLSLQMFYKNFEALLTYTNESFQIIRKKYKNVSPSIFFNEESKRFDIKY